jgi:hypothetical protein
MEHTSSLGCGSRRWCCAGIGERSSLRSMWWWHIKLRWCVTQYCDMGLCLPFPRQQPLFSPWSPNANTTYTRDSSVPFFVEHVSHFKIGTVACQFTFLHKCTGTLDCRSATNWPSRSSPTIDLPMDLLEWVYLLQDNRKITPAIPILNVNTTTAPRSICPKTSRSVKLLAKQWKQE